MGTRVPPKELLLKYCLLRVVKSLGARVKEQKRKVYLKTTWSQTAELRLSREMVPQCQWEHQNLRVFVSLYDVRQVRVPDTLTGGQAWFWGSVQTESKPASVTYWLGDMRKHSELALASI